MKQRCCNPKHKSYPLYGGKGINYTPAWDRFERFRADMGPPPTADHTLDRIDPLGNYEPANCQWATKREQAANRSTVRLVEYRGDQYPLAQLARIAGIGASTLADRLARGVAVEEAVNTKVSRGGDRRSPAAGGSMNGFNRWPSSLSDEQRAWWEVKYQETRPRYKHEISRPGFFLDKTSRIAAELFEEEEGLSTSDPDFVDHDRLANAKRLRLARDEASKLKKGVNAWHARQRS